MGKNILKILFFILLPAGFTTLGKFPEGMKYVCDSLTISTTDDDLKKYSLISFFTGVLLGSVTVPVFYFRMEKEHNKLMTLNQNSVSELKENLLTALRIDLGNPNLDFDVRVFTEDKFKLVDWAHDRSYLVINNYRGLAESDALNGLRFRCDKNKWEGLVGLTYNRKEMVWDSDISNTEIDYHTTIEQQNATVGTRFVMCIPIIKGGDNVCAIVSFDSQEVVHIPEDERTKWRTLVVRFAQSVHNKSAYLKM